MDWLEIGRKVIGIGAPVAGGLLGGPVGAEVGSMIASALGCENTPAAVDKAIAADPQAAIKLRQMEIDARTKLAELAFKEKELAAKVEITGIESGSRDLENVNKTMQAEAAIGHKWAAMWRPYWGFVSATGFGFVLFCLGVALLWVGASKRVDFLKELPDLLYAIAALFGVAMSVLGVASWHRGQMQRVQAGEVKPPGLIGAISSRIAGQR